MSSHQKLPMHTENTPSNNSITFTLGNRTLSVVPSESGSFECPCGHHASHAIFPDSSSFKAHVHRMEGIYSTRHLEPPTILSTELIDTPVLRAHSLIVNSLYRILICSACSSSVLPQHIAAHLRSTHAIVVDKDALAIILTTSREYGVPESPPPLPNPPFPPIEGLPVVLGQRCTECPSVYARPASLEYHFRTTHRGQRLPKERPAVFVQHLNSGRMNTYFAVQPTIAVERLSTDNNSILSSVAASMRTPLEDDTPTDSRNISPWLRVTRWHELISKHPIPELIQLAEYPLRTEFPALQDVVSDLAAQASACIDQTTTLVLQKLNSPNVSHEISNTPFKSHADKATLPHYMRVVTGLVAMLLRGTLVPLPTSVQTVLENFKVSLAMKDREQSVSGLLALLLSLWTRSWDATETERITDPTILYLALSSLKPGGDFQEPKIVTHTIACFEYAMRLVFLKSMHDYSTVDEGLEAIRPWFIEKVESSFNSLRTLQHFASSIAYQTMSLPRVWWTDREGYRSMLYRGHPVELDRIVAMLRALELEIKHLWEHTITFSLNLGVHYTFLYDDLSNKDPGYSFTTDPKNSIFGDPHLLLRTVLDSPSLRSRLISFESEDVVLWNVHELRGWLTAYARLSLLIMIRANLTGGSPGRITELTACLLTNTATYAVRNLVFFNKHLALLCTYLKTSSLTGYDRLIPHSLDAFTSDMLVQDLAIARPFARFAARICHANRTDILRRFDTHLFVNHTTLFTTEDVTSALIQIGLPHFEFPLNVNAWRHISTAFRRIHCSRFRHLVNDGGEDSPDSLQSGHNKRTEDRIYGLSHDTLSGAAEDVLPLFLDASTDWQIVCSVVPGGMGLPYQRATMDAFPSLVEDGSIRLPRRDENTNLEDAIQLLQCTIIARLDIIERKLIGRIMSDENIYDRVPLSTEPLSSCSSSISIADHEEKALAALRRALQRPNASWKNEEQKAAVLVALERKRDAIIIMATGSGKSMIPVIPSMVEENLTTVLILPFRSLLLDFTSKLASTSIPFEVYRPGKRLSGQVNLVIISADHATSDHWRESIMMVHLSRPVTRYVMDEAHVPPTASDYREALRHMSDLRCSFPVQMILMTGTAHDRMVDVFKSYFCLGDDVLVLRMCTNRPELRYLWTSSTTESLEHDVRGLLADHLKRAEDRAIVFVPFIKEGEVLADALQYPFFNGKQDADVQQGSYRDWVEGKNAVLVATSAFRTGNDYPHVRLVVHAGTPFEQISYIQEVSRAGRDGAPATCVLLQTHRRPAPDIAPEIDLSGRLSMHKALNEDTRSCIRFLLTSYIDGKGVYCGDLPENLICSRCAARKESTARSSLFIESTREAKRVRLVRQVTENDYVCNFKACLSKFDNTCAFCLVFSVNASPHDLKNCPTLVRELGGGGYGKFLDWRRGIKYSKAHDRICYFCHIPQGPNDSLHPTFERSQRACRYPDVVAPSIFALLLRSDLCPKASEYFGVPLANTSDSLRFINDVPLNSHSSNLTALFLWYAGQLQEM